MEEFDVGRVLAAAAPPPEAVPRVADLPARARALGRRRRTRRAVMTGGGSGMAIAAVVGVVVAAGGFGSGSSAVAGTQAGAGSQTVTGSPARPTATTPATSAPSTPATRPSSTKPSFPKVSDDPAADAKVTAALKAALPGEWQEMVLYRAANDANSYGAEYTWGQGPQEAVLDVSVGAISAHPASGTPSMCQTDPQHCTDGTATVQGHPVTWQYYHGSLSAPTFDVTDGQALVSYGLMVSGGRGAHLPGLDVMKAIGLNDQVAAALLAAWGHGGDTAGGGR